MTKVFEVCLFSLQLRKKLVKRPSGTQPFCCERENDFDVINKCEHLKTVKILHVLPHLIGIHSFKTLFFVESMSGTYLLCSYAFFSPNFLLFIFDSKVLCMFEQANTFENRIPKYPK